MTDKAACLHAILLLLIAIPAQAADDSTDAPVSPVDAEGHVVNFDRDIAPLLAAHCLECHGGTSPKADFRVDDPEILFQYVEPGDAEYSALYLDYLLSEDPSMLMPPPSHGGPLAPAELALIRLWIEEGATWPEGAEVRSPTEHVEIEHVEAQVLTPDHPLRTRVWAFQGYFHPAMVHFPIALLTLGALFVLLGLKWPVLGTQVPLVCLLLGSASAVVASLMGWSFAVERGFPGYAAGLDEEVNWHRWAGVGVAAVSVFLCIVAAVASRRESVGLTRFWKIGLLVVALGVGLVGHQGGELTYGKGFYTKAFKRLTGIKTEEVGDSIQGTLESVEEQLEGP